MNYVPHSFIFFWKMGILIYAGEEATVLQLMALVSSTQVSTHWKNSVVKRGEAIPH